MNHVPFHEFRGQTIGEIIKEWRDHLKCTNNDSCDSSDDYEDTCDQVDTRNLPKL